MDPALRASASGMIAQQKMVDVIANNLANVNTTGFKRSRASFEDLLYETVQGAKAGADQSVTGPMQIGHGVRLAAVTPIHSQGSPQQTGRSLDLAIQGDGFFQVQHPDGSVVYTRDGTFTLSDTGQLVTHDGNALVPDIVIPPDATQITITAGGSVQVSGGKAGQLTEVGKIQLARFPNPTALMSMGNNMLAETAASGQALVGNPQDEGFGSVLQGTLESSNVEVVTEMTDMIAAQRAYEINSRAVQTADAMMQSVGDLAR